MKGPRPEDLFLARLNEVQTWLKAQGIIYRILGSVASSTFIDGPNRTSLDFSRKGAYSPHQRLQDLDVLIPKNALRLVRPYQQELARDLRSPFNLELLSGSCHFDFRPFDMTSNITHRSLLTPIPTPFFDPVETQLLGCPVLTIDPLTLFHTYVTMGAILRDKDWPVAHGLAKRIARDGISKYSEPDFAAFHAFISERKRHYRGYVISRQASNWIAARIPGCAFSFGVHVGKQLQPILFGSRRADCKPSGISTS